MKKKIIIITLSVLFIISIIGSIFLYIENGNTALSLQKSNEELSTARATLSAKETELSDANDKIIELEGNVTDLQNQTADFEKQLKELKDKLARAEKEKAEREEAEKKEAAKAKAENKPSAQKTYEEWDISGYALGDDEVFGENPIEQGGEFNTDGATGNWAGVTIY